MPRLKSLLIATALTSLSLPALAWTTTGSDVSFVNAQNLTIHAKLYRPAGNGPFPAVVMLHGCSGAFSYSDPSKGVATLYREWADRLVAQGYAALLVDSFSSRNAAQNQCGNGSAGTSEVYDRPLDAQSAYTYLAGRDDIQPLRIGLLGWSHGASSALASMADTATVEGFRGAVAFYPGCGLYNAFGGLAGSTYRSYAPVSMMHGTADALYQSGACQARVQHADGSLSLITYTNAQHSFDQAKTVGNGFTQADVDAKVQADALALAKLASWLKN